MISRTLEAQELKSWLNNAKPGDRTVYFEAVGAVPHERKTREMDIAWQAYCNGNVTLVQRKTGPYRDGISKYDYEAVKL